MHLGLYHVFWPCCCLMKDLPLLSAYFLPQLNWMNFTLHKVEWTSCGIFLEQGCMDFIRTLHLPYFEGACSMHTSFLDTSSLSHLLRFDSL